MSFALEIDDSPPVSDAVFNSIINRLYQGKDVTETVIAHGVSLRAFFESIDENNEGRARTYDALLRCVSETMVWQIVRISDEFDDPARVRNRIEARKWTASKYKPSRFGAQLDVNVNHTVDIGEALLEARTRIATPITPLIHSHNTQVIDIVRELNDKVLDCESSGLNFPPDIDIFE